MHNHTPSPGLDMRVEVWCWMGSAMFLRAELSNTKRLPKGFLRSWRRPPRAEVLNWRAGESRHQFREPLMLG